jgi:alkylation response protein AidB-like acyl-CoA dehydrogenase
MTSVVPAYRRGFVEACLDGAPVSARQWIEELEAVTNDRVAPRAAEVDRDAAYPREQLDALARIGIFGMTAPEAAGGLGFSDAVAVLAVETIAAACASTAAIIMFHTQVVRRVVRHGSERQRCDDLPRLATGEWRGVSAWSEAGAGADKSDMKSRLHSDHSDWTVAAHKTYTSGLEGANIIHALVGSTGPDGRVLPTFVRVAVAAPQVEILDICDLVGLRGSSTGSVRIDHAPVTHVDLLGGLGSGRRLMADNHASGLNPGVLALGIGRAAFDVARRYVTSDMLGRSGLSQSQAVRFALSELEVELGAAYAYAAQAVRYAAAGASDVHLDCIRFKLHATARLAECVARAAQLCGAVGMTSELPVERHLRDAQAAVAMGPTNHLIREQVAHQILTNPDEGSRAWVRTGSGTARVRRSRGQHTEPATCTTTIRRTKTSRAG